MRLLGDLGVDGKTDWIDGFILHRIRTSRGYSEQNNLGFHAGRSLNIWAINTIRGRLRCVELFNLLLDA
jgi:hypothetical protein